MNFWVTNLIVNVAHLIIGYSVGWTAPMLPKLENPDQTPLPDVITSTNASWIGSLLQVGCIISANITGYIANKVGRKYTILLGGCLFITAYTILTFSESLTTIFVGRCIVGIGVGMLSVINMVYIGEITSPNIRGIILTSTGVFHTLGVLMAYSIGPFVSYTVFCCIATGICLVHIIGTFYIPESPLFYILKGKEDSAKITLKNLGSKDDVVDAEIKKMLDTVKQDESRTFVSQDIFTVRSNRKSLIITVCLFVFKEMSGIIALGLFLTTIFEIAASSVKPYIATIIIGVTQFCGTLLTPLVIERAGRKSLLLVSFVGLSVCMGTLALYFQIDYADHTSTENLRWLPLAAMVLAFLSYSVGLNVVPNALAGEMFRANVRSTGSSLSNNIGWCFGFASVSSFGYIQTAFGIHTIFWIFTFCNLVGMIFTLFCVPETKGKTLIEIEEMLST